MIRTLVCLLLTWLVWTWATPMVVAAEPLPTTVQLNEIPWPPPSSTTTPIEPTCFSLGDQDPFSAGQCTFQFMVGYFPKTAWGPGGPAFDYVPIVGRLGYMCTTPKWDGCILRGNFELLLEGLVAPVVRDFGSWVTGPNLLVRYNFVQPESALIPYAQLGAGFVFTDGWKTPAHIQELIGQEFEFLLRAEIGTRLMLTDRLSLDAEVGYQHISNAGIADRNGGVNNFGFSIGMTYFFGKKW